MQRIFFITIIITMLFDNQFVSGQELSILHLKELLTSVRPRTLTAVQQFADTPLTSIVKQIEDGSCIVQQQSKDTSDLIQKQEATQQQLRVEYNRQKRERRLLANQLLYGDNKNNKPLKQIPHTLGILSSTQHLNFIRQMKNQNQRRKNNRLKRQEEEITNRTTVEQAQRRSSEAERLKQIERRKFAIQQSLKKMRENHLLFLESEQESRRLFTKMKRKKRLYEQLKDTYQQNTNDAMKQEEERRRKERKEKFKLDLSQINLHQKEYQDWRKKQIQQYIRPQHCGSSNPMPSYQPPPHSTKITQLLREEQKFSNKVELSKKIASEKLNRISNYTAIVREKYKPKSPPQQTVATDRDKSNSELAERRSQPNRTQLGNQYLKQVRLVTRKRSKTEERYNNPQRVQSITVKVQSSNGSNQKKRTLTLNYIPEKQRKAHVQKMKRQEIQKILSGQNQSQAERLRRLKQADDRLSRQLKKKEAEMKIRYSTDASENTFALLLGTIRAKINLIDAYSPTP